jgi:hypothetical protein
MVIAEQDDTARPFSVPAGMPGLLVELLGETREHRLHREPGIRLVDTRPEGAGREEHANLVRDEGPLDPDLLLLPICGQPIIGPSARRRAEPVCESRQSHTKLTLELGHTELAADERAEDDTARRIERSAWTPAQQFPENGHEPVDALSRPGTDADPSRSVLP